MVKFKAQARLTRNYNSPWRNLDQWGEEFSFKELGGRRVKLDDDGSFHWSMRVIGSKTRDQAEQGSALRDHYEFGCKCEHDCCGHRFGWVTIRHVRPGIFNVVLHISSNT